MSEYREQLPSLRGPASIPTALLPMRCAVGQPACGTWMVLKLIAACQSHVTGLSCSSRPAFVQERKTGRPTSVWSDGHSEDHAHARRASEYETNRHRLQRAQRCTQSSTVASDALKRAWSPSSADMRGAMRQPPDCPRTRPSSGHTPLLPPEQSPAADLSIGACASNAALQTPADSEGSLS